LLRSAFIFCFLLYLKLVILLRVRLARFIFLVALLSYFIGLMSSKVWLLVSVWLKVMLCAGLILRINGLAVLVFAEHRLHIPNDKMMVIAQDMMHFT